MKDWQYEYCFVYDPMNCYPLTDFITCSDIDEVIDLMLLENKKIRLSMGVPSDMVLLMDFLKEFDNILIVIDEADQLFSRTNNPEALSWVTHYGRHANQGMILIARRPPSLPIDFTAQSLLCFNRVVEGNDKDYIKRRLGYIPDELPDFNWYCATIDGELHEIPADWIYQQVMSTGGEAEEIQNENYELETEEETETEEAEDSIY